MNGISFTQNLATNNNIMNNRMAKSPNFQGVKKTPNAKDIKKGTNLIQTIYKQLFLRSEGDVKAIKDGFVYTENFNKEGTTRTSKKFKLWSKKPEATIKENAITHIKEKETVNKDGTLNFEISDTYTPDYKVSVGYSNVQADNIHDNGKLKLVFGDKEIEISKKEREKLHNHFNRVLQEKFSDPINIFHKMKENDFRAYMENFYTTPETSACAILASKASVKEQLRTVPRSLPYGVECIMNQIAK